jgi:hypothetical protein
MGTGLGPEEHAERLADFARVWRSRLPARAG